VALASDDIGAALEGVRMAAREHAVWVGAIARDPIYQPLWKIEEVRRIVADYYASAEPQFRQQIPK
jgi:hypothetical protein